MSPTRRDFIRYVGLFLASVITRGCGPAPSPTSYVACYLKETIIPPAPTPPNDRWAALQECWYSLDDPRLQSFEDNNVIITLRQRHQEALQALVAAGELDPAVGEEITVAFGQAIAHIQRQQATCYIALPSEYQPREDLLGQAAALEEMAAQGNLDPAVVAQARAALARDIEWLTQFQAGKVPGALEEIEADPDAVEAARILVELLLGQ
jgi:hypothetical protein